MARWKTRADAKRQQANRAWFWMLVVAMALSMWLLAGCVAPDDGVPPDASWGCSQQDQNYWYSQGYQQGRADERAGLETLPPRPHELGGG